LLSHDRGEAAPYDLVALLREEILAVIAKHCSVDREHMRVKVDRGASVSMLGVSMDLPKSITSRPQMQTVN
jgi:cell division topological specificity factor